MKKFKLLSFWLLMIAALFNVKYVVMALTPKDNIIIGAEGNYVTAYTNNNYTPAKYDNVTDGNPHFPVKHYNGPSTNKNNNVYCTSGLFIEQPPEGKKCHKISWSDDKDKYVVGYLIQKLHNENASFTTEGYPQYYWSELIINSYLGTFNGMRADGTAYDLKAGVIESSTYKVLDIATYQNILNEAQTYGSTAGQVPTLTSSSSTLSFTDGNDGYYYSNGITINTSGKIEFDLPEGVTHYMESGVHKFKIDERYINNIGTTTFNIKVKSEKDYYYAQQYKCEGYQNVTPAVAYIETKSNEITLTGSVTRYAVNLGIIKTDSTGKKIIDGSKFLFQTEEQYKNKIKGETLAPGLAGVFTGALVEGVYYLTETEAPVGYNRLNGYIKITIKNNNGIGEIIVEPQKGIEIKQSNNIIRIKNTQTETKFSKISIVNQKELPGATLTILDENKEVIVDEKGNAKWEWVSGEEPHYIYGLPVGKYYLKEVKAPEGYALSEEIVAFEVKDDGSVTEVVMENALEVPVPDTLSSKSVLLLVIGMFDIALGIGILLYVKKNKITE